MPLPLALCVGFSAFLLCAALASALLLLLRCLREPDCHKTPDEAPPVLRAGDKDEVRRYTWAEIESLTGNFTASVVGRGGFSTVYLACLPGFPFPVAVKVQRCGGGERLLRAFRLELDLLRRLRHPHLVRLLAFSDDHEEQGALVLEYVPNGSLHEKLHGGGGGAQLSWAARMRILYEVADAIEYLHDGVAADGAPIVHGDVTSANVLLDARFGAKLCDFGSARVGFCSAVARSGAAGLAVGSPGYADPYYLRTGVASKKSDVYSFGVLALEVITGLPAVGSEGGRHLTVEIMPRVGRQGESLGDLVDPRLGGEFDTEEAAAMVAVAADCVGGQPSLRPAMAQVRSTMADLSASMSAVDGKSDGMDRSNLVRGSIGVTGVGDWETDKMDEGK